MPVQVNFKVSSSLFDGEDDFTGKLSLEKTFQNTLIKVNQRIQYFIDEGLSTFTTLLPNLIIPESDPNSYEVTTVQGDDIIIPSTPLGCPTGTTGEEGIPSGCDTNEGWYGSIVASSEATEGWVAHSEDGFGECQPQVGCGTYNTGNDCIFEPNSIHYNYCSVIDNGYWLNNGLAISCIPQNNCSVGMSNIDTGCIDNGKYYCNQADPGYILDDGIVGNAAGCPFGSSGTNLVEECTIDAGYSGSVTATIQQDNGNYYTSNLDAVTCPSGSQGTVPGTSGTGDQSGCTPLPGYSGSVIATSDSPYYTSNLEAVTCPSGSIGTVQGITGTMTWSGYTFPVAGVWDTISNDGWIFLGWTEFDATVHGQYITNNQYYRMTKVPVDHTDEFFDVTDDVLNNVADDYAAGFSRWVRKAPNASSVAQWDSNLLMAVTNLNSDDTDPQSIVELWNSISAEDWWNADYKRSNYDVNNIDFNTSSGCTPYAGYSGSVIATSDSPYYTSNLDAVTCPSGSSGVVSLPPIAFSGVSAVLPEYNPSVGVWDTSAEINDEGWIFAFKIGGGYPGWRLTKVSENVRGLITSTNSYMIDYWYSNSDVVPDLTNGTIAVGAYFAGGGTLANILDAAVDSGGITASNIVSAWNSGYGAPGGNSGSKVNNINWSPSEITQGGTVGSDVTWSINATSGCVPDYGNLGNVIATTITPYYINNISTLWNPAEHEDDTWSRTYSGWHGMYTAQGQSGWAVGMYSRGRHSSLDDKCGDTEYISSCVIGSSVHWPSYKRGAWMALFPGAVGPDDSLICSENTAGSGAHTQGSETYTDWEVNDALRWHDPSLGNEFSFTSNVSTYLNTQGIVDYWKRVWMQMDLGGDKLITHIVTQGRGYGYTPETGLDADSGVVINGDDGLQRVLNYYLKIWPDGTPEEDMMVPYDDAGFIVAQPSDSVYNDAIFKGNVDNNTKQYSALLTPTLGRYVRIYPRGYRGAPYMRAGVMVAN